MTFLPECGAVFQISLYIVWTHNDSMYVSFGGTRNTKTRSKFKYFTISCKGKTTQMLNFLPQHRNKVL